MDDLIQWAEKIIALGDEVLAKASLSEPDDLGFMVLCFLSKQLDHMQSIIRLMPSRDVILVARTMIDGLCQLLWAAKDPTTLPSQWRNFAWIHDWRVMQEKIARGETIPPERRKMIEDALQKIGDQFLTKKARKAKMQNTALADDPYYDNWRRGFQLRQVSENVGGYDLYQKIYEPFSDWEHWGPGGLGAAIRREGDRIVYSSLSAPESARALRAGFQCVLQTANVADRHFNTGHTHREFLTCVMDTWLLLKQTPGDKHYNPGAATGAANSSTSWKP